MANAANIKLGSCSVNYNGVDLGHTKGGVEVSYEPKYVDITADLYGDTVVDKRLVGEKFLVKVPLAEKTIVNLKQAIPQSTYAGAANARITIGTQAGLNTAKSLAAQLVIHPLFEQTLAFDVVLYKAYVSSNVPLKHDNSGETIFMVTFEALLDETKSAGNYLGLIGDSTK